MQFQFLNNIYDDFVERQRARRRYVFLILGLTVIAYCAIIYMVVTQSATESKPKSVPTMVSNSPAPTVVPVTPVYKPTSRRLTGYRQHGVSVPTISMQSVNRGGSGQAIKVYTTSSASPVSVGGGGGGVSSHVSGSGNTRVSGGGGITALANVSLKQSTSSFIDPSSKRLDRHSFSVTNSLASVQEVIDRAGPKSAKPHIRKDGWDDYGQDEEPYLDPVGEGVWILFFFVAAYGAVMFYRRKNVCK